MHDTKELKRISDRPMGFLTVRHATRLSDMFDMAVLGFAWGVGFTAGLTLIMVVVQGLRALVGAW